MKFLAPLVILCHLGHSPPFHVDPPVTRYRGLEARQERLLARMGCGSYSCRQAATEALRGLGDDAWLTLTVGIRSHDAEVRSRCRALLGRISSR